MSKEKLISEHLFMFPFQWDLACSKTKIENRQRSLIERVNIKKVREKLRADTSWGLNLENFSLDPNSYDQTDDHIIFSEYNFFYDNVRPLLYNSKNPDKQQELPLLVYSKKLDSDTSYYIKIPRPFPRKNKLYLKIRNIELRIFETGVGILLFHLQNTKYKDFQEILDINQFGRRVYVPFITISENNEFECNEAADKIKIGNIKENLKSDLILTNQDREKLSFRMERLSKTITEILGACFCTKHTYEKDKIIIEPIIDDRMYVMSWYRKDRLVYPLNFTLKDYPYNDNWYKYVFVDSDSPSCNDPKMFRELLEKATYARWKDYETLYGITRYSFVMAIHGNDPPQYLIDNFMNHYRQLAILAILQRASALRFIKEAAIISELSESIGNDKLQRTKYLYQKYLEYSNRVWFSEVTPQEQGIELFDMLTSTMNIQSHLEKLNIAIRELKNYADILSSERLNNRIFLLTAVGAFFAALGIITSNLDKFIKIFCSIKKCIIKFLMYVL